MLSFHNDLSVSAWMCLVPNRKRISVIKMARGMVRRRTDIKMISSQNLVKEIAFFFVFLLT